MIIVNQVERAKAIAKELEQIYTDHNIICYHSEFTSIDRQKKEECIKILFKTSSQRSEGEKKTLIKHGFQDVDAVILITTQVCELSLDISCDIQLSDLAPIDALAQRGGRLHRNGTHFLRRKCQCLTCSSHQYLPVDFVYTMYVFPLDKEDDRSYYRYVEEESNHPHELLDRSWDLLGEEYSFPKVVQWVNKLYPDLDRLEDKQLREYFYQDLVFGKQPKERFGKEYDADESEGLFRVRQSSYRTIEVIPLVYQQEILSRIDLANPNLTEAQLSSKVYRVVRNYSVTIKYYRFCKYRDKFFEQSISENIKLFFAKLPYHFGHGFSFDEPLSESQHFNII